MNNMITRNYPSYKYNQQQFNVSLHKNIINNSSMISFQGNYRISPEDYNALDTFLKKSLPDIKVKIGAILSTLQKKLPAEYEFEILTNKIKRPDSFLMSFNFYYKGRSELIEQTRKLHPENEKMFETILRKLTKLQARHEFTKAPLKGKISQANQNCFLEMIDNTPEFFEYGAPANDEFTGDMNEIIDCSKNNQVNVLLSFLNKVCGDKKEDDFGNFNRYSVKYDQRVQGLLFDYFDRQKKISEIYEIKNSNAYNNFKEIHRLPLDFDCEEKDKFDRMNKNFIEPATERVKIYFDFGAGNKDKNIYAGKKAVKTKLIVPHKYPVKVLSDINCGSSLSRERELLLTDKKGVPCYSNRLNHYVGNQNRTQNAQEVTAVIYFDKPPVSNIPKSIRDPYDRSFNASWKKEISEGFKLPLNSCRYDYKFDEDYGHVVDLIFKNYLYSSPLEELDSKFNRIIDDPLAGILEKPGSQEPGKAIMLSSLRKEKINKFNKADEINRLMQEPTTLKEAYKVLGLSKDAPSETVKDRYYALLKKYHPDSRVSLVSYDKRYKISQNINIAHDIIEQSKK